MANGKEKKEEGWGAGDREGTPRTAKLL